ncbi:MAG: T9SS type A sorting domain-containing protein [Segetibacter sp.]
MHLSRRNEIELVWETSEELNVSRYEIEQLNTTTKDWITKGTVYANGGSSAAKYNYTDVPNTYGSRYLIYRLKMIDKDGRISYSYMVKVNFEKLKAELFIQTNPVSNGELRYTITGLSTGKKAEVSIIDFNGRLLLKNTISSLMNNTLKISHLSAGMYKLVVRVDDTTLQQSFIK